LQTLLDDAGGAALPLPPALSRFYGPLRFAFQPSRPLVLGNFTGSLDGVASLGVRGHAGGGAISGENGADRALMALLRACASVVMEGAGTLRQSPRSLLTAQHLMPSAAAAFTRLRRNLGLAPLPLRVIVSGSGDLDLKLPLFRGEGRVLVLTRPAGLRRLQRGRGAAQGVELRALQGEGALGAREILRSLGRDGGRLVLLEGGPHLMGSFVKEKALDELFLTLAPQLSGRQKGVPRLGLVEGAALPPEDLRWGRLLSVKRRENHLFLRTAFA
jgi:riboflavin biosynthesis pyrimidine reductase